MVPKVLLEERLSAVGIQDDQIDVGTIAEARDDEDLNDPCLPMTETAPLTGHRIGNELYDGSNTYRMSKEWTRRAESNEAMGLPIPLRSMSVFGGRGPSETDPQNMDQVTEMMEYFVQNKKKPAKANLNAAAEFIDRINDLGLKEGDHEPHHQEALRRWNEMPAHIKDWKSVTLAKQLKTNIKYVPKRAPGLNGSAKN
jgi:hypothetical protein